MKKKLFIHCEAKNGNQHFYVDCEHGTFYLFSQEYRKSIQEYFGNGISYDRCRDILKHDRNAAVMRTIEKLPKYIEYVEKSEGIAILNKTKKVYA